MTSKIIYICYVPLTIKFESDFFINELIECGFTVEYWDVTGLFHDNLFVWDSVKREYIKKIMSYKELEQKIIKEGKDVIYFFLMYYQWRTLRLLRLLSKHNCTLYYLAWGLLPSLEKSNIKKYLNKIRDIKNICGNLADIITTTIRKIGLVKYYDVVFVAGSKAGEIFRGHSRIVNVNHWDYDDYMIKRDLKQRLVSSKYCLFLDDGLPDHPDFELIGRKMLEPVKYISAMNRLFDIIKNKYGLEIIIALHPKSNQEEKGFKGRKCFRYKTDELSRDCEVAITHASTSLSFPVLYEKPVILLYTDEYQELYASNIFRLTRAFADTLHLKIYNADKIRNEEDVEISEVDYNRYAEYKYNYLTSKESENRTTAAIIIDFIKKENQHINNGGPVNENP
jgi:hypothetical protein